MQVGRETISPGKVGERALALSKRSRHITRRTTKSIFSDTYSHFGCEPSEFFFFERKELNKNLKKEGVRKTSAAGFL